jgi:TetR/AcrR family fatty acid metabolism transcriptional regulator
MTLDHDSTLTSRARILMTAKRLFAENGYEQTPTATIARQAGTSESQLVRYFEGKAGLLEAIFNESWRPLNEVISQIQEHAPNGRLAILEVLSVLIEAFGRDPDIAFLFLFEGRRIRGHEITFSKGFRDFNDLLMALIRRAQKEGAFHHRFNEAALASALMGAAEGMIRDRIAAQRAGAPVPYTDKEIRRIFTSILEGL